MKRRKWLVTLLVLCVCLMCAIGFSACGKNKAAGKFSAATVSQIELGMSQKQVRDIIGKPDDSDEGGYAYYWYEDKIKNLLAEIEKEENEWDEDDFDEDLDDFGKEEVEDRLDQLYTQLEEMTYKFIMVTFSSDEKVTSVYLDCEHVYDEGSDYSSAREKTVRNARLDVDKVDVATGKLYTFDGETITEEETLHVMTKVSSVKYSAEFSDGSYIKRTTTPRCLGLTDDKKQVKYEWSDMLAQYNVQIAVDVQGESNLLVVAEGVTAISSGDVAECADKVDMISLPSTLVEIGGSSFVDFDNVTEIVIPDGVTSIGGYAFYGCNALMEIVIPDSVTSIGYEAFKNCNCLTIYCEPERQPSGWNSGWNGGCPVVWDYRNNDVANDRYIYTVVDGVRYALKDGVAAVVGQPRNITTANILETVTYKNVTYLVTSIGEYAFYNCSSLTKIVIPDSVTSIGYKAFYDCRSLTYNMKNGWSYLGNENNPYLYLMGAPDLTSFETIENGCKIIGEYAFTNCNGFEKIVIPDSVTSIGRGAFTMCEYLTEIKFGQKSQLTSLGALVFESCYNLMKIVIPDSVTWVGGNAFDACRNLTIYCEAESQPSGWDTDWNNDDRPVVWDCNNNDMADNGSIYTVIDGLRYGIKDGVATVTRQPSNIKTVNILATIKYKDVEYSVTSIGEYAFLGCASLTEIIIPNSVTSIGERAFYGCNSLTIYCEAESQPSNWHADWNSNNRPVVWGYTGE